MYKIKDKILKAISDRIEMENAIDSDLQCTGIYVNVHKNDIKAYDVVVKNINSVSVNINFEKNTGKTERRVSTGLHFDENGDLI
jgi:hypothetical protein